MTAVGYGAVALDGKAADIQPVGTAAAAGSTGMGADAGHVHAGFALLASTGAGGYTLGAAAGTILSWTAPDDGNMHVVLVMATLHVTSAETGGALDAAFTTPDGGTAGANQFLGQNLAAGFHPANQSYIIEAGSTFTLSQGTALTAGAAVLWAELRGS